MAGFAISTPAPRSGGSAAGALRIASTAVAALLLGLAVGAIILAVVATRFFGFHALTVTSASMAPAIDSGDLIVVRPLPIAAVREGDVVMFDSGGERVPTVHRVIGINEVEFQLRDGPSGAFQSSTSYRLVTQGDANPAPDNSEVTADMLRGEVWFRIPHAGAIADRGIVVALGVVLGASIAAWALYEIALRLKDARHGT